jgi:glyoxylase-like metal-dependent hydrolase (beta-lactamase superfamily II)
MHLFPSKPRFVCIASALLFVGFAGATAPVYPQTAQDRASENDVELVPVQGNISMLAGAGGNITVQVGRDGVLLVDSGVAAMSDTVVAAIRTLSKGQITYIVNTSDRPDHVGGNEPFARIGRPLAIGRAAQASVFIIAFSTILERMRSFISRRPRTETASSYSAAPT